MNLYEVGRDYGVVIISLWNTLFFFVLYKMIFKERMLDYKYQDWAAFKALLRGDFRLGYQEVETESKTEGDHPDDYWDGEELDYDTGEIGTNTGPTIRHPKNRDRAYSGSAERFHDGGW